jgi:hypothetical protein
MFGLGGGGVVSRIAAIPISPFQKMWREEDEVRICCKQEERVRSCESPFERAFSFFFFFSLSNLLDRTER